MTKRPGPSVRRRQLGAMLRQLRRDANKTRKDAAEWLEIGEPTISKIELGRQSVRSPSVRLLCQLYDVDASTVDTLLRLSRDSTQRGWWAAYRDTLPEWARHLVGLESDAVDIWGYESEFVPGLLQTSGYVEAITRAARPNADADEVARSIELRRERQSRLDGEEPPHLHLYVNEAALRRSVGTPAVMREQLEYLRDSSQLEHISLRVVPFSAGAHAAMTGSFAMMQFPDEEAPAFVYVETERGAVYQEDPGDIDRYTVMVNQLDEMALSVEDTRTMLDKVASEQ